MTEQTESLPHPRTDLSTEQHIAIPLLEGVHTSVEALGLRQTTTIGTTECRLLLPVRASESRDLAAPATPDGDHGQDPGWPAPVGWGSSFIFSSGSFIIRAVGVIPVGITIPSGREHVAFDRAVAQWKHFLRDWLAVAAEGPTDLGEYYAGATFFGSPEHDAEIFYEPYPARRNHWPRSVSSRAWSHALGHAAAGDQPPLARGLMTTATRAAITANWRAAIIDAATATEVALTAGLAARLSAEASPHVIEALIGRTRMLGSRLDLARELGMTLPATIRADLVEHRNAAVHRGADVTGSHAEAAISAAWTVVHEYDPLPACCQQPFDRNGESHAE